MIILRSADSLSGRRLEFRTATTTQGAPADPYIGQRRMTFTPTIDGGVAVFDGGYSQNFQMTIERDSPSREEIVTADYFVQTDPEIIVQTSYGAWRGYVERVGSTAGRLQIDLQIVERLS